jgi:membrane associated rhomboid family serine protease
LAATGGGTDADYEIQRRAREIAEARYGFRWHLPIYILVNAFLIIVWFYFGGGFFWPIFPLAFWGIGVLAHYWGAYRSFGNSWVHRETERILREEKEGQRR